GSLGDGHLLKTGAELTHHAFRSAATTDIADLDKVQQEPTLLSSLDASAYLQDECQITPQLFTNIGLRGYYFASGKYSNLEPRISLSYLVTEDLSLKAEYSTANQALHLVSRNDIALPTDIWVPSTPQLKPESATEWSAGTEASLAEHEYKVSVEGYYKEMHNLLEYKDTANLSLHAPAESYFTSGDGSAYGVELFINKQIGRLTGWIGYTLSFTQRTFPELNDGLPFNPRYDRTHDISIVTAYALNDRWNFGAVWVYGTGNAYTMPTGHYEFPSINAEPQETVDRNRLNYSRRNGYRLPAYHRLDLSASLKFSWFGLPWVFSMNIYNAYNHKNVFAQYITPKSGYNPATNHDESSLELKRVTYFPILPTIGLSVKF
ncbi:MAG: TonB-dependent receptor, partial [Candidatus Kapaibacterium sp.]